MKEKAFTLIELIISIGILMIVTGLVVASFRLGGKREALDLAAQDVASVIKKAENMTLTGKEIKGEFPRGGYGLHFDQSSATSYILFADFNNDLIYNNGETIEGGVYSLPPKIKFLDVQPNVSTVDIVFKPPKKEIFINKYRDDNELVLKLQHLDTKETKIVRVDRISGRISSE